jgi:hypothetical protein
MDAVGGFAQGHVIRPGFFYNPFSLEFGALLVVSPVADGPLTRKFDRYLSFSATQVRNLHFHPESKRRTRRAVSG